jgi:hypothetical protein
MEERIRDMQTKRFWSLRLAVVAVVLLLGAALFVSSASAGSSRNETKFRWDIINMDFAAHAINPGGHASAIANDGSSITLTGEGTFNAASNFGNRAVTGGGTWQTFDMSGSPTASGTYQVTGFVSYTVFRGVPPPLKDNIGDPANARSGLAFLAIQYSDGSTGVLTVSCEQPGPPAIVPETVFEGIRVSKDYADYWNGTKPVPGVNGNRTLFHVLD